MREIPGTTMNAPPAAMDQMKMNGLAQAQQSSGFDVWVLKGTYPDQQSAAQAASKYKNAKVEPASDSEPDGNDSEGTNDA